MMKYLVIAILVGGALTGAAKSIYEGYVRVPQAEGAVSLVLADYRQNRAATLQRINAIVPQCLATEGRPAYSSALQNILNQVFAVVIDISSKGGSKEENKASLIKWIDENFKTILKGLSESELEILGDELKLIVKSEFAVCIRDTYANFYS